MLNRTWSLGLLLSCLALAGAAPSHLALLRNASLWDSLSSHDWWARLQSEVVRPLAAAPLAEPPDLSARLGPDKVELGKLERDPTFRWVRHELQASGHVGSGCTAACESPCLTISPPLVAGWPDGWHAC